MKLAERGSGRGPKTVHDNFTEDSLKNDLASAMSPEGASYSKYADPDAEGIRPVLMTITR